MRKRFMLPFAVAIAIAACQSVDTSGCVIGPCDTSGGTSRIPVVAGFPSARMFAGDARLSVGDTITLYAIRIGKTEEPCSAPDTLNTNVLWGVSNGAVATITPLGNGGVRVRATAPGTFRVMMREAETGPLTVLDVKSVFPCPTGFSFSDIAVAP